MTWLHGKIKKKTHENCKHASSEAQKLHTIYKKWK